MDVIVNPTVAVLSLPLGGAMLVISMPAGEQLGLQLSSSVAIDLRTRIESASKSWRDPKYEGRA